jgi:phage terminase large subunit-like protein
VRQHSDALHPATKYLSEHIESGKFRYEKNDLLVINFENARCTYDTNLNRYVNKKKSNGKVDMVVALINATYLLNQDVIFGDQSFVQII